MVLGAVRRVQTHPLRAESPVDAYLRTRLPVVTDWAGRYKSLREVSTEE